MDTPLLVEMATFDYLSYPYDLTILPHLHHFHQLDVVLEGEATFHVEGQGLVQGTVGGAWLIPPLARHWYEVHSGYRHGSFKFYLAPCYWPVFGNHFRHFRSSVMLRDAIEHAAQKIYQSELVFADQPPLTRQHVIAVATLCLTECARQTQPNLQKLEDDSLDTLRALLWPLLERIENQPHHDWSISRLAAECYLSPDHFSRCFHRILGQTPQQYLLAARMRSAAAKLLATPPRRIKEVAAETGYASVQSFSRAFKRVFGIGPDAYRKTSRRA